MRVLLINDKQSLGFFPFYGSFFGTNLFVHVDDALFFMYQNIMVIL